MDILRWWPAVTSSVEVAIFQLSKPKVQVEGTKGDWYPNKRRKPFIKNWKSFPEFLNDIRSAWFGMQMKLGQRCEILTPGHWDPCVPSATYYSISSEAFRLCLWCWERFDVVESGVLKWFSIYTMPTRPDLSSFPWRQWASYYWVSTVFWFVVEQELSAFRLQQQYHLQKVKERSQSSLPLELRVRVGL